MMSFDAGRLQAPLFPNVSLPGFPHSFRFPHAVGILCTRGSLQHAFVPPWTAFVCDRYMGSMGAPNHFGTNTTMVEYFGVMTIVYAAAALLSLGVEFPFAQLERLLLFPAKKRVWV